MQIRTKERLITAIALAVIGLIAALIWWTYEEVDVANRQRQQASEIARELSQLRLLTFEYRLYHNERAKEQWYAVSNRVDRVIANTQTSIPTQDQLLASMRERRAKELRLFSELTSAKTESRADAPLDDSTQPFEGTLLSRLLAEQQNTFTDVFRLTDIATERINDAMSSSHFAIAAKRAGCDAICPRRDPGHVPDLARQCADRVLHAAQLLGARPTAWQRVYRRA